MADPAVHWHEGMLLRPQHFQAADRHWQDHLHSVTRWGQAYHWGIRTIKLDTDQLKSGTFTVRRLDARLKDGTIVRVPEDVQLAPLSLEGRLAQDKPVEICLAVPVLRLTKPNVSEDTRAVVRYRVAPAQDGVADENDGRPARDVQLRQLNVKLLFPATDDIAGYEPLPIARVIPSDEGGAAASLDPSYIPPLLACEAWDPLHRDILKKLDGKIGTEVQKLARKVRRPRFGTNSRDELLDLEKFRLVNEANLFMRVFVEAMGIHPFDAYLELCRLLGRLAILGKGYPTYSPLAYKHDDLGTCFEWVKKELDELLARSFDSEYFDTPFVGKGHSLVVTIKPEWLAKDWDMYVGVESTLTSTECAALLTGPLNMKIGELDRAEIAFRAGTKALHFEYDNDPRSELPRGQDLTYFRIDRKNKPDEWAFVQSTFKLAVRLSDRLVGTLHEKTEFELKLKDGKRAQVGLTLYVVPPSSSQSE